MDLGNLLEGVLFAIVSLVCVWGVVWVIQTYVVGQAPFIPDQFKQIINWVVLVIGIIASLMIAFGVLRGSPPLSWRLHA